MASKSSSEGFKTGETGGHISHINTAETAGHMRPASPLIWAAESAAQMSRYISARQAGT